MKKLIYFPPLAGLCSFAEAQKTGLSIETCVERLKRFHYAFLRLMEIFQSCLTAETVYELKMAFSYHSHLCAEHVTALRERVGEMRTPPLGLDKIPAAHLERLFLEVQCAATPALLMAVYEIVLPALLRGMERHTEQTNPLVDQPTLRLLKFARLEAAEMLDYGQRAVAAVVEENERNEAAAWLGELRALLAAAGDLDGSQERAPSPALMAEPAPVFQLDKTPQRDERFADPYNMGVHAEEFLYDPQFSARDKTLMLYFKRLREIDVPEMMATILAETKGKPWGFYRDLTRQLWDEARHAMMGEVGFAALGIDWPKFVRVNFTWSKGLNEQLTPKERHAVLYFIEQGLMPKSGKRYEWEVGHKSGDPLAKLFQDFDWADEVLHARIGRDWYLSGFEKSADGVQYGSDCWSRVVSGWQEWKDAGLTSHANWWPALYEEFCRKTGRVPDKRALAYHKDYSSTRADLKEIAASA